MDLSLSNWSENWDVPNRPAGGALFGLCALRTFARLDRSLHGAFCEVNFGDATARLPAQAVVAQGEDGATEILLNINTHLVPNGTQRLEVKIVWPDGSTTGPSTVDLEVDNAGALAVQVTEDLEDFGTPVVAGRFVDSALYPYRNGNARPWFHSPERKDAPPLRLSRARDTESARKHLAHWGFCVLNATIPEDIVRKFNAEVDEAFASGQLKYTWGSSERIYGAHRLPHGKQIWTFPPVIRFLREWFRDEPCACQSLLYMFGSEQSAHQDTIHLTPYPAGYMCGVWVALEDVKSDSGELFVYPGSQCTDRLMSSDLNLPKVSTDYSSYAAFDRRVAELLAAGGYERVAYRPKAGEILVWHENLIHGGSKRINVDVTRRSIVSHYFSKGGIAYYDSRGEAAFLEEVV